MSKFFYLFVYFFGLLGSVQTIGQTVSNVQVTQEGKEVVIRYVLTGTSESTIKLFISEDQGNTWQEITNGLSGDIGKNVNTGWDKRIRWNVLATRDRLVGSHIMFKVQSNRLPDAPETKSFTDPRDGQEYNIVTIGTQTWMAENLNYATGRSWCYNNNGANCATYGSLYDWQTAKAACPAGWHLPTDAEWEVLINFLGGKKYAGGKMKSTTGWKGQNTGATNQSGFAALPGGCRSYFGGVFLNIGLSGYWWSATEDGTDLAWYRDLGNGVEGISRYYGSKASGLSVRCLRD